MHRTEFYEWLGETDSGGVLPVDRNLRALAALAVANGVADAALLPVLPALRADLGLSGTATGLLLSSTTVALLAAAFPIGMAAARFGTGRLLLASALLMPAGLAGLALAGSLPAALAARAVFGVGFAIVWIVGPGRAVAAGRGPAGAGVLIAASGAGWLVGPVVAGAVAEVAGWRAALLLLALLLLPVSVPFVRDRSGSAPVAGVRLAAAARALRLDAGLRSAVAVSALLGVVTASTALLGPLVLSGNGLSAGAIGAVFGVSALVWTVAAAAAGRAVADTRLLAFVVGLLSFTWLLPAASLSTAVLVVFLVLSAAFRSAVNTLVYPLAVAGAGGEAAATTVMGVMNVAWAVTALVTPLLAGAAESEAGVRLAFGVTAGLALGVAVWAARARVRIVPAYATQSR